jgi:hypothetical protein
MMYKDPLKVVEKYFKECERRENKSEKILVQALEEEAKRIRKKEESIRCRRVENEYISEYFRKRMNRTARKKLRNRLEPLQKSGSEEKLSCSPVLLRKHDDSKRSELVNQSSQTTPDVYYNSDTEAGKVGSNERFKGKNRMGGGNKWRNEDMIRSSSHSLFSAKGNVHEKNRAFSKPKYRVMHDYYQMNVKPRLFSVKNDNKKVELEMKSFVGEKKKSFKNFKFVKLF